MNDAELAALGLKPPFVRKHPPAGPPDVASVLDAPVSATPDAEALADPERRLTFAQLDHAVDGAAHVFARLGVKPGDRVAASLPNICDLVIAFMAVQRMGAVWVGVNRILPPADKAYILAHSDAKLLLTDPSVAAALDRAALPDLTHMLNVDDEPWTGALRSGERWTRPAIDPFAPAAIMYTSGTTGAPKGVVHSQHNMITVCAAGATAGNMNPGARRGVVLPLTITNVMILGPVYAFWNGKACILGQTAKTAPMVEWLHRERIGAMAAVPTMIYDLLQSNLDLPEDFQPGAGGAPVPVPMRQAFEARYKKRLMQSYGLTEAPTVVADNRRGEAPPGASGQALHHLALSIRDSEGRELPAGDVGEVCIGAVKDGPWADVYAPPLGYWRDPQRTEALLKSGVVHTGDLGHLDAEGWLHIADRSTDLILRGGSNVYPTEIERILYRHPKVADCAVVGRPDPRLGMRTVAVVQPVDAADEAVIKQDLIALCSEALVRYKVPDEWLFVREFPRNAMGKIVKPTLRQRILES